MKRIFALVLLFLSFCLTGCKTDVQDSAKVDVVKIWVIAPLTDFASAYW